jgi:hypothetical protein
MTSCLGRIRRLAVDLGDVILVLALAACVRDERGDAGSRVAVDTVRSERPTVEEQWLLDRVPETRIGGSSAGDRTTQFGRRLLVRFLSDRSIVVADVANREVLFQRPACDCPARWTTAPSSSLAVPARRVPAMRVVPHSVRPWS